MEIVAYDSTDVICVGERLPFQDRVFDAVHCNAVLEHVKDPFSCAKEMMRVLKPGGDIMCCVPFLQAYHGYPHHYYNMTHQGLINLFPEVDVLGVEVYEELKPITSLIWLVSAYQSTLPEPARSQFLNIRLGELVGASYSSLRSQAYVTDLSPTMNQHLACCNTLFGYKKETSPMPLGGLTISQALYGADHNWVDVTASINSMVRDNHLFISCNTKIGDLFGDPTPGKAKQLKVRARWHSSSKSAELIVSEYGGRLTTPLWL